MFYLLKYWILCIIVCFIYNKSAYHPKLMYIYQQLYEPFIFDRQHDAYLYFRYEKTAQVQLDQGQENPIGLKPSCFYFV